MVLSEVRGFARPVHIKDGDADGLPVVVSFSGGRTSGRMLRMILDMGIKPIVLFGNTGKERDETLSFIHEVETRWEVPVVWLEYRRIPVDAANVAVLKTQRMKDYAQAQVDQHWFEVVNYDTAARHTDAHGPFDDLLEWMSVLPNPRVRACTKQLKIATMLRYLWSQGIYEFRNAIGIRADEADRAFDIVKSPSRDNDVRFWFPLMEQGITEADIFLFWAHQEFDLQLKSYEGNCHLCFLKKKAKKIRLISEQPHLTDWWEQWEEKKKAGAGARWRAEKGHSLIELRQSAADIATQQLLDLDTESMDCACTAGLIGDIEEGG